MNDKQTKIMTGCNFITELIRQGKYESEIFKRASKRLIELLSEEPEELVMAREIGLV